MASWQIECPQKTGRDRYGEQVRGFTGMAGVMDNLCVNLSGSRDSQIADSTLFLDIFCDGVSGRV